MGVQNAVLQSEEEVGECRHDDGATEGGEQVVVDAGVEALEQRARDRCKKRHCNDFRNAGRGE